MTTVADSGPLSAQALGEIAAQFPVLDRRVDGHPLTYLDSAATSQTPQPVIDALTHYYTHSRASIHRGVYPLAVEATELYEGARQRIARWLGSTPEETIFTANATAGINLVAYTWGRLNVNRGDLVVLTEMEHHSNIVPWQLLCQDREAELAYVPVSDDGRLDLDALDVLLERGPKLLGIVHVSNVLGTINPVAEIAQRAHAAGAAVLVDGTQAVPQLPVDLPSIDADFYAWTAHKAYGPTGIGVLHGRRELLEQMPPFIGGGHMIRTVAANESTWTDLPHKFEAGTSQIAEAIGTGAAVDWINGISIDRIRLHEEALVAEALARLAEVPGADGARTARESAARCVDLVHARRGAPARHRRDPRARGGVRAHGASLHPAADAPARSSRDDAGIVRDPQLAGRRRAAGGRAGDGRARVAALGPPVR